MWTSRPTIWALALRMVPMALYGLCFDRVPRPRPCGPLGFVGTRQGPWGRLCVRARSNAITLSTRVGENMPNPPQDLNNPQGSQNWSWIFGRLPNRSVHHRSGCQLVFHRKKESPRDDRRPLKYSPHHCGCCVKILAQNT